jgi:hypothetical protein
MTKIIKISGELDPTIRCNRIYDVPEIPVINPENYDKPAENIYVRQMASKVRKISVPEPKPYDGFRYLDYCAGDAETELIFQGYENTIKEREDRIEGLASKVNKLENELIIRDYTLSNIYNLTFWKRVKFAVTGKL